MKKVYINTPHGKDANSFWRCMGPMGYLAKHSEGEIEIYCPPDNSQKNWSALADIDLLFMHRPCSIDDLIMMQIARNMNIPVWIDYDDWLFHLPEWNPNKGSYHTPVVQNVMATCIACADIVSVSTHALADAFLEINKHVVLIPNAYRSDLFPYRKKKGMSDRNPIFTWRGTNTHEGDLLSVQEAFTRGFEQKVNFLGSPPYSLLHSMSKDHYKLTPMTDVLLYWKSLYTLSPKVMLFPLQDAFFNHCKSNIAWMEAIHAGALCVAPDTMAEWKHPGVIVYKADDWMSFKDSATAAMAMSESDHRAVVSDAYDYIHEKYDISVINKIRIEIMASIFSPGFARNDKDPYNQLTGIWALSVLKKEPLPKLDDILKDGKNEKQSVRSEHL